jgi:hypothetical protein
MKTNHVNFADQNGKIYCFRYDVVAELDDVFVQGHCVKCPYYNGNAQGEGIECLYADGSGKAIAQQYDPYEAQAEAKELKAKMGVASDDELRELQSE